MKKRILLGLALSLMTVFIISGCVSSRKYQDLEKNYATTQQDNAALQREVEQVRAQNAQLAQQKAEQEKIMNEMIASLKAELADKSIEIQQIKDKLVLTIVDRLFFESGSAEVNREGRDILARIAPTLKNADSQEIRVVGHADSIPIGEALSAKFLSNWELSTARATAIIQILQWGYNIAPQRLVAEGVGHHRPVVMETNKNRAFNRVVEIVLTKMPVN